MSVSHSSLKARLPILAMFVVAALAVALWQLPGPWRPTTSSRPIYSGTVEADLTLIATEIGGRLVSLNTPEGAVVSKGDVLARLDDATITAQMEQAQAAAATARARLAAIEAGSRPEDVAAQRAVLAQTIAARDGARDAWQAALRSRDNPADLEIRIEGAKSALQLSRGQVTLAQAALETARVQRDHDRNVEALSLQVAATEAGVAVAEAVVARNEAQIVSLMELRDRPLLAQSQVTATETAFRSAEAAVESAQARLDAVQAGPTLPEVTLAKTGVDQAQAGLAILAVQREKLTVRSPLDGLVVSSAARVGELVAPGAPLLTIADLGRLYLTVFVPEDEIGRVRLGQQASITVDAYPGRTIAGSVSYLSPRAEFTPKSVQTQKERVSTVFAVRIRVGTGELTLIPGMPADVTLLP